MPIYNAETYLRQCINSIINQTYTDIEIVLINDGSTDKSGEICDEYAAIDSRIRVIHQVNKGKILARYEGLKQLECDYATYVDADDWIDINTYKMVEKHMEAGIDIISFPIIRYYDESYQYTSQNNFSCRIYCEDEIKKKIIPSMIWNIEKKDFGLDPSLCNKVIKRNILLEQLEQAKDLSISYGDDIAVTYPAVLQSKSIVFLSKALYYHRQRNKNVVADYFIDKDYYKKLFLLYDYLSKKFLGEEQLITQLDYFFAYSAALHLKKYGYEEKGEDYLFPFSKIPEGKKIILYGAGKVGKIYYEQVKKINYCEIVAWVDNNYEAYSKFGVESVENVMKIKQYDYIVIAINNRETVDKIRTFLINKMDVDEKKIISN